MKNLVIILAAGMGIRFENDLPKQFHQLNGKTIFEHTIEIFENHEKINSIVIVINQGHHERITKIIHKRNYQKINSIVFGGVTRQESSAKGVAAADDRFDNILIHDVARPFTSPRIIDQILEKLTHYPAVNVVINPQDTLAVVDNKNTLQEVLKRDNIKCVQTPQGFSTSIIKKAHQLAIKSQKGNFTDDCSLIKEFHLGEIGLVDGDQANIKITTSFDLKIAQIILETKSKK